jgi:serine phosphatase RsbU (regulator of sigma subunit)
MKSRRNGSRLIKSIALSLVLIVVVALISSSQPVLLVEKLLDDNWYRLAPPKRMEDRIVIIEIDDRTLENYFPEIPLPRDQIALLIDALLGSEIRAKTVTVDLYFEGPDRTNPGNDTLLSYILAQYDRSVVCGLRVSELAWDAEGYTSEQSHFLERFSYFVPSLSLPTALQISLPPRLYLSSARHYGHIDVYKDETSVHRELPLFVQCGNAVIGALALETICSFLDVPRSEVKIDGNRIDIIGTKVPVDEFGGFKLRHFENSGGYQSYSMIDVLEDLNGESNALDKFQDKIVLIGINSKVYYPKELSYTPGGRERPNVYLHADIVSNMLSGFFAKDVARPVLLALLVSAAFATVLMIFFGDKRVRLLLSLAVILIILVMDFVLFQYGVLFPAVPILLVSIPLAVFTYFSSFREQEEIIRVQERETFELRKKEESLVEIEKEIRVARAIQEHLLPKSSPVIPGFDVAGVNLPAKGVSGDFFDFIEIKPGYWSIVVADVSGKGISAALLMTAAQSVLRAESLLPSDEPPDCSRIIAATNNLLHAITDPSRFVTMFFSILDTERCRLHYVNAGHNPPVSVDSHGKAEYLQSAGLILGALPDIPYQTDVVDFSSVNKLVIYTDGIVEGANLAGELYGEDRLLTTVERERQLPPEALTQHLLTDVLSFGGEAEQSDDITVVVVGRQN